MQTYSLNPHKRKIQFTRNFTKYAEGSVLVEFGHTKVICTATVENSVPKFLKGQEKGWITAEYNMLPRSTHTRNPREATKGKQSGRTLEIQRLIARSLRTIVDLNKINDFTITIDCDVIQADGGTRTASISGACIALYDAFSFMLENKMIQQNPMKQFVAAVSVGIVDGEFWCDLAYEQDSNAEVDMNLVMTENGELIEIQGTAEKKPFSTDVLFQFIKIGKERISEIITKQKTVLDLE